MKWCGGVKVVQYTYSTHAPPHHFKCTFTPFHSVGIPGCKEGRAEKMQSRLCYMVHLLMCIFISPPAVTKKRYGVQKRLPPHRLTNPSESGVEKHVHTLLWCTATPLLCIYDARISFGAWCDCRKSRHAACTPMVVKRVLHLIHLRCKGAWCGEVYRVWDQTKEDLYAKETVKIPQQKKDIQSGNCKVPFRIL